MATYKFEPLFFSKLFEGEAYSQFAIAES